MNETIIKKFFIMMTIKAFHHANRILNFLKMNFRCISKLCSYLSGELILSKMNQDIYGDISLAY